MKDLKIVIYIKYIFSVNKVATHSASAQQNTRVTNISLKKNTHFENN